MCILPLLYLERGFNSQEFGLTSLHNYSMENFQVSGLVILGLYLDVGSPLHQWFLVVQITLIIVTDFTFFNILL